MNNSIIIKADPNLDLVLERIVDVPKELVWAAWTTPEHLMQWFTPVPWKTVECEIDLRPGGMFRTVMQSPEGEKFPNLGCYLEITKNERLIWTDTLEAGFRPSRKPAVPGLSGFTAVIAMESHGKGTKYTATAIHRNAEDRKLHEEMGFHEGWGKATEQLVEAAKKLMRT
ncbi:MAG: polyketide cyclase [Fibrobacteres bacterium]|nr:polyketide cyclase [Fibrobacterota bacterium]